MKHNQLAQMPKQTETICDPVRSSGEVDERFHGMLHRLDDLLGHSRHIESKLSDKVSQLVGSVPNAEKQSGVGSSECLADKVHSYLTELQQTLFSIESEVDRL